MVSLLNGARVVDFTDRLGAPLGAFLASLGAEVTKVREKGAPGEDPAFVHDAGKQIRTLDLSVEEDVAALRRLIEHADFLAETQAPGRLESLGLGWSALEAANPRLIQTSITPFGSDGPYAGWRGGELVVSAMGGVLRTVGYPDRAPVKEALDACAFHACAVAAAGTMFAHYERGASGRGQHVDVSMQEVGFSRNTNGVLVWQFDRRKLERSGYALRYGKAAVRCIWELADGFCFHTLMTGRLGAPANTALSRWIDEAGFDNPMREVEWERYDRSALPADTRATWEAAIDRFFRSRTRAEINDEGRRRGINAAVAQTPEDILADPQLRGRGYWRELALAAGGRIEVPDYFVRAPETGGQGGTA